MSSHIGQQTMMRVFENLDGLVYVSAIISGYGNFRLFIFASK